MSTSTLSPWDSAKFMKLKESIADEADVRARLAKWDSAAAAARTELAELTSTKAVMVETRTKRYDSLRGLLSDSESLRVAVAELLSLDDSILAAGKRIAFLSRGASEHERDNLVRRIAVIDRIREDMVAMSPFSREIHEVRSELRALSEYGNAAKRIELQIADAKRSNYDNRDELVATYESRLAKHNRKLTALEADLNSLLERVFS